MLNSIYEYLERLAHDAAAADYGVMLLCIIVVASMIVLDAVTLAIGNTKRRTGLTSHTKSISVDGSNSLPIRSYLSERQGLAGRPDAIISENGYIIPVERKPLARKVRDRYVAQLLVYMRLIEEFEGKKPPYGYLILGQNCRKIKIDNTPQRQAWVDKMIDEMRAVLHGMPTKPTPESRKCTKCDVRTHCAFAIQETPTRANSTRTSTLLNQVQK